MAERWRPWRELQRRNDVAFRLVDMPCKGIDALYVRRGDTQAILVGRHLDPVERLAALAHELVHLERGGVTDCLDEAKEERAVDRIVAGRLVPENELEALIEVLVEMEGGVTAEMVAEEFEVPTAVARRAMAELVHRRAGRRVG